MRTRIAQRNTDNFETPRMMETHLNMVRWGPAEVQ